MSTFDLDPSDPDRADLHPSDPDGADLDTSDFDGADWVALAGSDGLDVAALGRLHGHFGSAAAARAAITGRDDTVAEMLAPSARAAAAATCRRHDAGEVHLWIREHGAHLVVGDTPEWPRRLVSEEHWVPALTVRGSLAPDAPVVAIVGMRRCSHAGASYARSLAAELAEAGVSIVSGLAFGIDAAAHRGTLDVGGHTVAVLAGGLARVSPRAHLSLAGDVVATGGALVSHVPPRCDSPGWRFPVRNRIIAGIADVVVVVEAAAAGGALSTARHARDLGRPVLAVPGYPWAPTSAGTCALLRDGAELCCGADDVLVALGLARAGRPRAHPDSAVAGIPVGLDPFAAALLAAVDHTPTSIEDVARRVDRPLVDVLRGLGGLELDGHVEFPQPSTVVRPPPARQPGGGP